MGPRGFAFRMENTNAAGAFGFVDQALLDFHMGRHGREAREAAQDLLADAGRLVGHTDRAPPHAFGQVRALLGERRRSYFNSEEGMEAEEEESSEES